MRQRTWTVAAAIIVWSIAPTLAYSDGGAFSPNLRDLIPNLLQQGITLAPPEVGTDHSAHFISSDSPQLLALQRLNADLGGQLSSFPLSSSAGGFTYQLDPALGVFTRSTESFGPIYSERFNTVGEGRFSLGVNFSHFSFDEVDDLNLRDGDLRLVFSHEDTNQDGSSLETPFEGDVITAELFLKMQSSVTAFVATFGLSDRFDLGLAVPLVDVQIEASAAATVRRLATGEASSVHTFENGSPEDVITQSGSATGLGDVVIRGKLVLSQSETGGLALIGDVRAPTGEERDLLGLGEWQFKGGLIGSVSRGSISPHGNVAFASTTGDIPNEFTHALGIDWAASGTVTLAADLLGRYFLDSPKVNVQDQTFEANVNPAGTPVDLVEADYPILGVASSESRYLLSASFGFKVNVVSNLLLSLNGLVSVSTDGLQDHFTPLIGMDYSF